MFCSSLSGSCKLSFFPVLTQVQYHNFNALNSTDQPSTLPISSPLHRSALHSADQQKPLEAVRLGNAGVSQKNVNALYTFATIIIYCLNLIIRNKVTLII